VSIARDSILNNLDKAKTAEGINDLKALAETMHALKGTLLQCGFLALAEEAQRIVSFARERKNMDYLERLNHLQQALKSFTLNSG
ncbi:MAG: Hpt domain-containing protein, partial [Deltaproteobacteria bacterium]|nr:Hpt domain-containing protein [Candidatus Tharpella sp.]